MDDDIVGGLVFVLTLICAFILGAAVHDLTTNPVKETVCIEFDSRTGVCKTETTYGDLADQARQNNE